MTGIAITPTAILNESAASARNGVLPATIGALGAAIALNAFAPLFATASIPISVLGVVLGLRSRTFEAVAAGGLAIICAMVALLYSDLFWIAFGVIGSAMTAG
jgi:hypothetical protein